MITVFEKHMQAQASILSGPQIKQIGAAATEITIPKKHVLLQAGEVCRVKIFVIEGFLRTYRIGDDGTEHIMQFSPAPTWTTEGESYTNATPSGYYIDALEDSKIMMWRKSDFDVLLSEIPALKTFSEQLISTNLHQSRNRLYKAISATAEEKYEDFVKTYPGILQRVPLRMIASYLGISLKTLGRIRQAQLQR
ncbi:Crp/Fnr family transcriptional regulator [Mucilaginibacter litoreus]|uniref:Crp/Fnr family transcriptional regulator n=1 Tax=Mucilaginibacter litoreus TaxID=1048221 RepID=A0ABW3AYE0_9SPHI